MTESERPSLPSTQLALMNELVPLKTGADVNSMTYKTYNKKKYLLKA